MEALSIGGLAMAGQVLRNTDVKKPKLLKKYIKPAKNFNNIYESNNTKRVQNIIENVARDRTALSKIPETSGVIPKSYNKRIKSDKVRITNDNDSDSVFTESFDGS